MEPLAECWGWGLSPEEVAGATDAPSVPFPPQLEPHSQGQAPPPCALDKFITVPLGEAKCGHVVAMPPEN